MSWRDRLREASFRGVAFLVDGHDHEFGRRTDVHEYALRAEPWVEDLGRSARRYMVDAYLIGPDYDLARDQLTAALEAEGPATLVHPWLGDLNVACLRSSVAETAGRGGEALFRLEFVEAGSNTAPDAGDDTQAIARSVADQAAVQAAEGLTSGFSVARQPGFVLDQAAGGLRSAASAFGRAAAPFRAAADRSGDFIRRLEQLSDSAEDLTRSPGRLAAEVLDIAARLSALADGPDAALAALRPLMRFGSDLDAVLGQTPARNRQRENQTRLVRFVRQAAGVEAVRVVAGMPLESYDHAARVRAGLAGDLDALALEAADAADDATYQAVEALRRAMVRDITARGGALARLVVHVVPFDAPLLVIAHQIYGDARRAPELAVRNRVVHPGFIAAGDRLQALAGAADA